MNSVLDNNELEKIKKESRYDPKRWNEIWDTLKGDLNICFVLEIEYLALKYLLIFEVPNTNSLWPDGWVLFTQNVNVYHCRDHFHHCFIRKEYKVENFLG